MCITVVGSRGYILGRCPFGTNKGPGKFCMTSEMVIDLSQEIADEPTWDPSEIKLPHYNKFPAIKNAFNREDKFATVMPLLLKILEKRIYIDGFINDIMTIVVREDAKMIKRAQGAVPLALHAMF